jgi:hypothetical protein
MRREHDERRLPRGSPFEQVEQLQLRARQARRLDVPSVHRAGKVERDDERFVGTKRGHRQPLPRRPRERDHRNRCRGERREEREAAVAQHHGLGEHVRP